jgi:K+-sensing histidine kinase KdpD
MCRVNVLALNLRLDGVDVVGWVETHGRAETEALFEGLTILLATRDRAWRNDIAGIRS